jgi:hypothetical protein
MMISWGILLPVGTFLPRFFKQSTVLAPPAWFKYHRLIQVLGVILSLAGYILGIKLVQDTEHKNATVDAHFGVGTTVFVLGWVIVFLGIIRPDKFASWRKIWFYLHVWLARIAVVLGFTNVFLGLKLVNTDPIVSTLSDSLNPTSWLTAYIVIFIVIVLTWITLEFQQGFFVGALAGHEESLFADDKKSTMIVHTNEMYNTSSPPIKILTLEKEKSSPSELKLMPSPSSGYIDVSSASAVESRDARAASASASTFGEVKVMSSTSVEETVVSSNFEEVTVMPSTEMADERQQDEQELN